MRAVERCSRRTHSLAPYRQDRFDLIYRIKLDIERLAGCFAESGKAEWQSDGR
jgi:hypothetical protein